MSIARALVLSLCLMVLGGCESGSNLPDASVAGDDEVAQYMRAFEGRGDLTDASDLRPPDQALAAFRHPDDVTIDLIASEPVVNQPVELNFDHRGRLWVVQYNQYPYPAGLKVTGLDYHLRAQFDRVPDPPPDGTEGADKITILEDTDGDGVFETATDAITGLNIATSVTLGRGHIWVLNPPYLLAYPDPDGDGLPDGEPEVHLEGFGLEDTHAVANSLRWGPDGWLYGAQGSTTTATVRSAATDEVHFKGQAIWRYHPETRIFELFAEGGGNTFHVEIDDKGRIYSGHNGAEARGQHYKQGAYYVKNWGKHGALTNPYAFGFFPHMALDGDEIRFTHAFLIYDGGALPDRYIRALIGINPLHGFLQVSRLEPDGSTFRTVDTERLLETDDHWFRPVDIKTGPDGGVYLADWYDSRLTHVDPRDTWHRSSGRIYRLRATDAPPIAPFDLSTRSTHELIDLLAHENKWFRRQALRLLGDRKDASAVPRLRDIIASETGQTALEALWALNLSGGFDEAVAAATLTHDDPYVRLWTIRLLGDARQVAPALAAQLARLAHTEPNPEVRSQMASSAKRLPGPDALPIIQALLTHNQDVDDPNNPLLIWWALEAMAETDRAAVLALFDDPELWNRPLVRHTILERLMQRYVMAGGPDNLAACTRLLEAAPSPEHAEPLLTGLNGGLRGRPVTDLPPSLVTALERYPPADGQPALALKVRQGDSRAVEQALAIVADEQSTRSEQLAYLRLFSEIDRPETVPVLLDVIRRNTSGAVWSAALHALQRYDDDVIGTRVAQLYPDHLRADPDVRAAALDLFATRPAWAGTLLDYIDQKRIDPADVPVQVVQTLSTFDDPALQASVRRIWPDVEAIPSESIEPRILQVTDLLRTGTGDPAVGHRVFEQTCGACHRLHGEGGTLGPDLTGYDRTDLPSLLRNTIDPSADIREGYVNYLVTTTDGRTLAGAVVDRSGGNVTLRSLSGQETTLPPEHIAEMNAQAVSLMPERLLESLTDQQIRDLFAYLSREQPPP